MCKKAFIAIGLLFGGCVIQQPPQQSEAPREPQYYPQPSDGTVYYYEYRDWGGPGWYYGVYFRDEARYRHWRNQRRSRRYYRRRGGRVYPVTPRGGRRGRR